jgi:hypothetical protein
MKKFDTVVDSYLSESVQDGILQRPLKSAEVDALNNGKDVVITINPDKHLSKFAIAPYDNEADMQNMSKLHSETMDGDFTYNITEVDWNIDLIKITVSKSDDNDDTEENQFVNDQFEDLIDDEPNSLEL